VNITYIMQRDILAANREAAELRQKDELTRQIARRERLAKIVNVAVWTAVLILALIAAFVAGYWKCGKDDLARQAEQERAWAEQDAKIAAEVLAMSNSELIEATERDAAKRRKAK